VILEIAANSVASALAAQEGGAGRVELCTALELGGLTPSYAQIALAREKLTIPLYVLIRPAPAIFSTATSNAKPCFAISKPVRKPGAMASYSACSMPMATSICRAVVR
jgi:hypothetical protein